MWYECIPPAAIIMTCLYVPQFTSWYFNKALLNGNPFRRDLSNIYALWMFNRDVRIDGAPWTVRGLEKIPDE